MVINMTVQEHQMREFVGIMETLAVGFVMNVGIKLTEKYGGKRKWM